jgi:hypothetical protein
MRAGHARESVSHFGSPLLQRLMLGECQGPLRSGCEPPSILSDRLLARRRRPPSVQQPLPPQRPGRAGAVHHSVGSGRLKQQAAALRAVCAACSSRGATRTLPSWIDTQVGPAPFPVEALAPRNWRLGTPPGFVG